MQVVNKGLRAQGIGHNIKVGQELPFCKPAMTLSRPYFFLRPKNLAKRGCSLDNHCCFDLIEILISRT